MIIMYGEQVGFFVIVLLHPPFRPNPRTSSPSSPPPPPPAYSLGVGLGFGCGIVMICEDDDVTIVPVSQPYYKSEIDKEC